MIKKIKNFISDNQLIPGDTRIIFAAVSGGVDSCVLLHLMSQLSEAWHFRLEIVHYNHKTRAGESDRDQAFVAGLSEKYGLSFHVGKRSGASINVSETVLREARYAYFDQLLAANPHSLIATGHNRDDQVETFLMRLAKGSGLKGLLAIPSSRIGYIRPLLAVSRREILDYADENLLAHANDKSNQDIAVLRNRIRHRILPALRAGLDKDLDENIYKVITNLAHYHKIYEDRLQEAVVCAVKIYPQKTTLHRRRYAAFNELIRRGLIEYCISKHYHVNYKVSDRIFKIWDLFIRKAQSGRRYAFLLNHQALAERDHIVFREDAAVSGAHIPLVAGSEVPIDEKTIIFWIKSSPQEVVIGREPSIEYVDGDKCGDELFVRFWQKGDRFKPLGMRQQRKLSDFFIDLKLSLEQKKRIPLICNNEQIVWIAGYRINEDFKISGKTKKVYRLEIKTK